MADYPPKIRLLRIENKELFADPEGVLKKIKESLPLPLLLDKEECPQGEVVNFLDDCV